MNLNLEEIIKLFETNELGTVIRKYRKQKGYTQVFVAEKIGITSQHYSKIERGEYSPSLQTFFSLVELLDIEVTGINKDFSGKISNTMSEILHHLEKFNKKQQEAVLAFLETMAPSGIA